MISAIFRSTAWRKRLCKWVLLTEAYPHDGLPRTDAREVSDVVIIWSFAEFKGVAIV